MAQQLVLSHGGDHRGLVQEPHEGNQRGRSLNLAVSLRRGSRIVQVNVCWKKCVVYLLMWIIEVGSEIQSFTAQSWWGDAARVSMRQPWITYLMEGIKLNGSEVEVTWHRVS